VRSVVVLGLALARAAPAGARVLGGGAASSDCTIAFDGVDATDGASGVLCVDGDPACDADGVADGTCRFSVAVCARAVAPQCGPSSAVDAVDVAGLSLALPALPASTTTCAPPSPVAVLAGTVAATTLLARQGGALKDVDFLDLCCARSATRFGALGCALEVEPSAAGCPAGVLPAGVARRFDRMRLAFGAAAQDPDHAAKPFRTIAAGLKSVRTLAKRIARHDACGDALGLVVKHAQDMLAAARATH